MSLVGTHTKDSRVKTFVLCKMLHCLPSQLEMEDSKTIEEFIIINNELNAQEESRVEQAKAEAQLRGFS